jgi:carbonic anhydrase
LKNNALQEEESAMRKSRGFVVLAIWMTAMHGLALAKDQPTVRPDEAIRRLEEGNSRYSQNRSTHPNSDVARRTQTATDGQHPFATVLACSDSRVPLEIIFDQGIGDVFAIRVAGNVCGVDEMGSVEYGVDHLGTPLLVILGHSQCGAVTAAATGAELHGNVKPLVAKIAPAVSRAQKDHPDLHGKELVPAATETNVWEAIEGLFKGSAITRGCVQSGKLKVVGAIYDVKSGQVKWLGEHPRQKQLLQH